MKMFKHRTKFEAIGAICVVILLVAISVMAGTRIISDSGDNIETFITNSNGGVWDATGANIQVAIDDLNTGNGTVWFPTGVFTITNLYINHSGVTLEGQGSGHWGNNGATVFKSTSNNEILNISCGGAKHGVTIKNIKFLQDDRTTTGEAIVIGDSHATKIIDCGFHKINDSAIRFINNAYSTDILRCNFQHCGNSVLSRGVIDMDYTTSLITTPKISNCVFEADYYAEITGNSAYGIITDNFIESNGTNMKKAFINGSMAYATISDNTIYDYDGSDSSTAYGIYANSQKMRITNNYIHGGNIGVFMSSGSHKSIVSDNVIWNQRAYGITIQCQSSIISNNKIQDGGGNGWRVAGVTCSGNYNKIEGNIIEDWEEVGIRISGSHCSVTDNFLLNLDTSDMEFCIYNEGGINKFITNNKAYNQLTSFFDGTSQTGDIILNNYGYNNNSLFPFYKQNTAPTIADNCTAYWYDLDDDYMYQITNSYGSVWYVNMTKTI